MQRMCNPQAHRIAVGGRLLLVFAALLPTTGCAARWDLNYEYGLERAKKLNQPMLLYFKDWSSPEHRNVVVNLLDNSTVAKELQGTVNIELLHNWGPEAKRYGTTQTPQVFVFCRPDGTEVDRLNVGKDPITPQQFADWIRKCKAAYRGTATQPTTRKA